MKPKLRTSVSPGATSAAGGAGGDGCSEAAATSSLAGTTTRQNLLRDDVAEMRAALDDTWSAEAACAEIANDIAAAATRDFISRHYDALALDYTVLSLWDEALATVRTSFVHQDGGTARAAADIRGTWEAGDAPLEIPCDVHSRHVVGVKPDPRAATARKSASASPGANGAFSGSASLSGSAALRLHRKTPRLDASGTSRLRPGSSGAASAASGVSAMSPLADAAELEARRGRRGTEHYNATARSGSTARRGTNAGAQADTDAQRPHRASSAAAAASAATDGDGTAVLRQEQQEHVSAEEVRFVERQKAIEEERQRARAVQLALSTQLQDPKMQQRDFVVDSRAGRVIPVVPAEEVQRAAAAAASGCGGASRKGTEASRFTVADGPGPGPSASAAQQQQPPASAPATTRAAAAAARAAARSGGRPPASAATPEAQLLAPKSGSGGSGGGGGGAARPRHPHEAAFFTPESKGVAMVINLTPSGGVGVRDSGSGDGGGGGGGGGGGIARRSELKLPQNKMTRGEYQRMVAQPNFATDSPVASPLEPPPLQAAVSSREHTARGSAGSRKDPPLAGVSPTAAPTAQQQQQQQHPSSPPAPGAPVGGAATARQLSATGAEVVRVQQPAIRPSPRPPSTALHQRTPRGARAPAPSTPSSFSRRGPVRRSAADRAGSPAASPPATRVFAHRDVGTLLQDDDFYGGLEDDGLRPADPPNAAPAGLV